MKIFLTGIGKVLSKDGTKEIPIYYMYSEQGQLGSVAGENEFKQFLSVNRLENARVTDGRLNIVGGADRYRDNAITILGYDKESKRYWIFIEDRNIKNGSMRGTHIVTVEELANAIVSFGCTNGKILSERGKIQIEVLKMGGKVNFDNESDMRCNNCMVFLLESEIIETPGGEECCPKCKEPGYLMDIR